MAERCDEEALLSAWLDGELGDAERHRIARHVAACASCASDLEALRIVRTQLRSLPERQPPAELVREVAEVRQRARTGVALVAAAGVLLLATIAADGGTEEPPRTVDVPVESFVADHVTRTSDGTLFVPAADQ